MGWYENNHASCWMGAPPVETIVRQPFVHLVDYARPTGYGLIAHRYVYAPCSLNIVFVVKTEYRSFVHRKDYTRPIGHDSIVHKYKWAPKWLEASFFDNLGTGQFSTKIIVHYRLTHDSTAPECNYAPCRLGTSTTDVHRIDWTRLKLYTVSTGCE